MTPRPVIFDLDLTLVESGTEQSWLSVLTRRGVSVRAALQAYRANMGKSAYATVQQVFPELSAQGQAELVAEYDRAMAKAGTVEMPGATKTLHALYRARHPLYLSTGASPVLVDACLSRHRWHDLFDVALGSTPECAKGLVHLSAFADDAGMKLSDWAADAVTVGDGPGEMVAGQLAGVAYRVAYTSDPSEARRLRTAGANLRVSDLVELVELCAHPRPLEAGRWKL